MVAQRVLLLKKHLHLVDELHAVLFHRDHVRSLLSSTHRLQGALFFSSVGAEMSEI